jgi:hypothetical protein
MLPLQISRLFDAMQTKDQLQSLLQPHQRDRIHREEQDAALIELQEERRKNPNRRNQNRREKQQAILLNTRKPQGRRFSSGRRATDPQIPADYRPISFKG